MNVSRREFMLSAGAVATAMPSFAWDAIPPLKVRQKKIEVGAERPFSVLHVSDSHVARIDSRDTDAVYAFAKTRSRIGRELGEYYLDAAVHRAQCRKMKVIHSGDFVDFMGEANLEYASRRLGTDDIVACVGNHEYWLDANHRETEAYKAQTIPRIKGSWAGLPASTLRVDGVNFFVFDNAFETVTGAISEAFEKTVAEGLPIVMVCHVPLWAEACPHRRNLCGMPGSKRGDAVSCAFVDRARHEPLVKAVLAGHVHKHLEFAFSDTARELVAGALFNGDCTEIEFS